MEDPWDSPWATSGPSDLAVPTFLQPTKQDHNDDDGSGNADEGFSSPNTGSWGNDDWSAGPWARNVDSAISLGDIATKGDAAHAAHAAHEDVWSTGPTDEATLGNNDDSWAAPHDATQRDTMAEEYVWTNAKNEPTIPSIPGDTDALGIETRTVPHTVQLQQDSQAEHYAKGSSKVQELVGMYNDMARERSKQRNGNASGAWTEEPQANAEEEGEVEQPEEEEQENEAEATRQPVPDTVQQGDSAGEMSQSESPSEESEPPSKPQGPNTLSYPIDMSKLDDLFPSIKAGCRSKASVSDALPKDSFTTIPQRKVWYRISRYGSARQHDMGEGYSRITWPSSEVRKKTIQIVRRWMEQDSIAGRVVLGGKAGAVGASLFNWGSNEPTVEIGELLRQRRNLGQGDGHSRGHSMPLRGIDSDGVPAPASVPATPAFGSSLSTTPMPASPWAEDAEDPKPTFGTERVQQATVKTSSPVPSPLAASASGAELHQSKAMEDNGREDEDDDEWGEMMTSPPIAQADTFGTFGALDEVEQSHQQTFQEEKPREQVLSPQIQDGWGDMNSFTSPVGQGPSFDGFTAEPTKGTVEASPVLDSSPAETAEATTERRQAPIEPLGTAAERSQATAATAAPLSITTNDAQTDWGFGDWTSPKVESKPNPLDNAAPTALRTENVSASETPTTPGWGFGDVSFFDSTPTQSSSKQATQTTQTTQTTQIVKPTAAAAVDQNIDNAALTSALQSLPDLTYMLK